MQRDEYEENAKINALRAMRKVCAGFEPDGKLSSVDVLLAKELQSIIAIFNATAVSRPSTGNSDTYRSAATSFNFADRVQQLQSMAAKFWNLAHTWNQDEYERMQLVPDVAHVRIDVSPFRRCDNGIFNWTYPLSVQRPQYFAPEKIIDLRYVQLTLRGSGGGFGRLDLGALEEHVVSSGGGTAARHVRNIVYFRPQTTTVVVQMHRHGWTVQENCSHPASMDGLNFTIGHLLNKPIAQPYKRPHSAPPF